MINLSQEWQLGLLSFYEWSSSGGCTEVHHFIITLYGTITFH